MAWPTVTIAGVNRTSCVSKVHAMSVEDTRSATPSSAIFTIEGGHGYVPAPGQVVSIAYGAATIFSGLIASVEQTTAGKPTQAVYHCSATGWGRLFDQKRVWGQWKAHSATDLIGHVVAGFTAGFTTTHVQAAMTTIDTFTATGETPSECLTAIMEQVGGRWYIDEAKDVHAFTTVPEAGIVQPDALTEANCRAMSKTTDWGDVITRQRVAGKSTTLLVACDANTARIPVASVDGFATGGGTIRVTPSDGSAPFEATYTGVVDQGEAFAYAFAQLGAQTIAITPTAALGNFDASGGWTLVNGMYVKYGGKQADGINGVPPPATAFNSISIVSGHTVDVQFGVAHGFTVGQWVTVEPSNAPAGYRGTYQITAVPYTNHLQFLIDDITLAAGSTGYVGLVGWVTTAIPANSIIRHCQMLTGVSGLAAVAAGAGIQFVAVCNDTTAQTALAAMDGTDGIREGAQITDASLAAAEATGRGGAELAVRKSPEVRLVYETTDIKTRAGTQVVTNLYNGSTDPAAIAGTHLVTKVTYSDFSANAVPRIRVETTDRKYSPTSLWKRLAG